MKIFVSLPVRIEHATAFAPLGEHQVLTGLATGLDVNTYARREQHRNILITPITSSPEKNRRVSIGPSPFPFFFAYSPF
jgi:hypothetical protein